MRDGGSSFAIEAVGLTRRFGATVAVRGLDLQVRRGEIQALLGPDGAGKTTTLRLLCGALPPTAGCALIDGADPRRALGRIGYMPQRFSLYGDLTVQENVDFYADLFQVPPDVRRTRLDLVLEVTRLAPFRGRLADHLSGGMKQKLALACTLVHRPTILLLDEPTTGVDPVSRREFWRILYRLHRDGATILVTTPYMDEAERCTSVALMDQGEVILVEAPDRMRQRMRGEVVEIRSEPKALSRRVLRSSPEVRAETVVGDRLRVVVADARAALPSLTRRLADAGVTVHEARPVPPTLEDVFVSLVGERRAGGGPVQEGGEDRSG